MSVACCPWFQWGYDLESDHAFELPLKPWKHGIDGVGGSDTAASGSPEAYVIREDNVVHLELRVKEYEMAALKSLLAFARNSGEPFNFRPDNSVSGLVYSVYLHQGQRWEDSPALTWERDSFLPVFIVPLVLRTEDGGDFDEMDWSSLAVSDDEAES